MNAASIRKFCLALPGATHDIKWGADHVYSVGEKMFACVDPAKVGSIGDKELKALIARSHALVAAKLPKKVRESLK